MHDCQIPNRRAQQYRLGFNYFVVAYETCTENNMSLRQASYMERVAPAQFFLTPSLAIQCE